MKLQSPICTLFGFVLFAIGFLSLILGLVGLELTPVNFIYGRGVFTLIIQLIMLFGGMILMYVSNLRED